MSGYEFWAQISDDILAILYVFGVLFFIYKLISLWSKE